MKQNLNLWKIWPNNNIFSPYTWLRKNKQILIKWFLMILCVHFCCQHDSRTNNCKKSKFGILYLYYMQMLPETFYGDWINSLWTERHKKNSNANTVYSWNCSCIFICLALNVMKRIYFCHVLKNMYLTEYRKVPTYALPLHTQ